MVAPNTQCKPLNGQQQFQSLQQASQSQSSSSPFLNNTTPISLRAHLEAAISNPSSPSAQANLLKQLQSTLAAIRPAPSSKETPASSQPTFARVPSITPAAVASALAATAGRRHTLPSTSAVNVNLLTQAQKQRLEQIRYYQQLIAQLNTTMPSSDGSVPTLPFEARPMDSTKTDASGFNAVLGLNPMSADDPSWIGHGFQAQGHEDFLSSPEWTDPSPALTDSMSFEIDSCGPSPLVNYDDDLVVPGIAGAPLFPPQDGYASSNVSPLELSHNEFSSSAIGDFGAPEMGSDFTLFPEARSTKLPVEMAFSKLSQPAAGAASTEDPAYTLLRALSSAALSNSSATASVAVNTSAPALGAPALTASPLAFTSLPAPTAAKALAPAPVAPAPTPAAAEASPSSPALDRKNSTSSNKSESRGTKRRLDTTDLLPLDAPIQKRTYYTVSATSRRDTAPEVDEFAEEEAAIRREKDPRVAKRLSNTLAARRSRHRKAEELRLLHEKIESLTSEVESWKRRCELAEKERDDARAPAAS